LLVLGVILLASAAYTAKASVSEPTPIRESLVTFPMQLGRWNGTPAPALTPEVLSVLGVDEYLSRIYRAGRDEILGLYIGYYQSQRQGDAIHSPLNCLPGAGWEPIGSTHLTLEVPLGDAPGQAGATRTIEINRYLIRKGVDVQVVLYWYQSHDRVIASEYWSKAYMVLDAMRLNRTDAALVRVVSPVIGTGDAAEPAAERQAVDFVRLIFPLLGRYLPA